MGYRPSRKLLISAAVLALTAGSLSIPAVRVVLYALSARVWQTMVRPFTEEGALDRLSDGANRAVAAADYKRADARLTEWARRWKGAPRELAWQQVFHAEVLVRLGREREAFDLLRQAIAGGFDDEFRLSKAEAFDTVRNDPQFVELLAKLHDYAQKLSRTRREAGRIPEGWVPSASTTFQSLRTMLADRDPQLFKEDSDSPIDRDYTVRTRRGIARAVASLRYIAAHSGDAATKADAEWEALQASTQLVSAYQTAWDVEESQQLVAACDRVLSQPQPIERRNQALLYKAFAIGRSALPSEWKWDSDDPPTPNCKSSLPLLEPLCQSPSNDRVAIIARAERARCLVQDGYVDQIDADSFLRAYEELPEIEWRHRLFMEHQFARDVRRTRMLLNGPPPFEAPMLDGGVVNLAMLRGKVVLLDFWSPG